MHEKYVTLVIASIALVLVIVLFIVLFIDAPRSEGCHFEDFEDRIERQTATSGEAALLLDIRQTGCDIDGPCGFRADTRFDLVDFSKAIAGDGWLHAFSVGDGSLILAVGRRLGCGTRLRCTIEITEPSLNGDSMVVIDAEGVETVLIYVINDRRKIQLSL